MKLLTVDSPEARTSRVWLNFKEVTNQTFQAEVADKPNRFSFGMVGLYPLNEHGKRFLVTDDEGNRQPAKEYRKGLIFWALKKQPKH